MGVSFQNGGMNHLFTKTCIKKVNMVHFDFILIYQMSFICLISICIFFLGMFYFRTLASTFFYSVMSVMLFNLV